MDYVVPVELFKSINKKKAYVVGLRSTMLQIFYLYQYWTVAETQKKGRSTPRPCVEPIINMQLNQTSLTV